jgi:hypothetical protein
LFEEEKKELLCDSREKKAMQSFNNKERKS